MEYARLVAVVAVIATVFIRDTPCMAELNIILWSDGSSAASGEIVNGLSIDVINGSNTSLEAVVLQNVTRIVSFRLDWFKDGSLARRLRTFNLFPTAGGVGRASYTLPISEVIGNKSGNYSVHRRSGTIVESEVYVTVIVGDVQRPNFTVFPQQAVNCSSANQSTTLMYVAVGFPRPVYTLRCSGVHYTPEPSTSGEFLIPPEVCCLGSKCLALAYNGYGNPTESPPTILRNPLPSDSCQQHTACLSPGLEIFLQSCLSTAYDGSVNGQTVNVIADDPHAVLEVIAYHKSSATTQLLLTWYKDGWTINANDNTLPEPCEGSDEWGSWMRCGYRLPLFAFKDNMSGNYSVELRQANIPGVLAAAWLTVAVGSLYNCTSRDVAQPNAYGDWSRYPATCNARCPCTNIASLRSVTPLGVHFVSHPPAVINATLDTVMLSYVAIDNISANASVTYSLNCSAVGSSSRAIFSPNSSNTGVFWISAPPCESSTTCYASAWCGNESSVDSPITVLIGRRVCSADPVITDNRLYIIASATTLGAVTLAAVLITVMCCRTRKERRLAALKRYSAGGTKITQAGKEVSSIDKSSSELHLHEQMHIYPHYPYKITVNGLQDCLETDGVSSSFVAESNFIRGSTSQNDVLNNRGMHGLHSSTGLSVVVDSTGANSPSCVHRSPTLVIISAANVQVGSHNTMVVNNNSDSTCDISVDPEYCTASLASEDCHCLNDETGMEFTMEYHVPDEHSSDAAQFASSYLPAQGYAEDQSAHECAAELPSHHCDADLHPSDWPADLTSHDCPADLSALDGPADLQSYDCAATQPADSADLVLGVPYQSPHDWLSLPGAM